MMKIIQRQWSESLGWKPTNLLNIDTKAQLVLVFASTAILKERHQLSEIKHCYPAAIIMGCSTAGEIMDVEVNDDTLTLTAITFDDTKIRQAHILLQEDTSDFDAGKILGECLNDKDLVHVFTLSDGLNINGSELVKGLLATLPKNTSVTGGLSGDGERFNRTYVYWGDEPETNAVAAIGFYSTRLKVGYGSLGGWDPFGPERLVTKSEGNILFEVDGKSALDLYKKYLGEYAKGLPATGLLFPLSLREREGHGGKVRTILGIHEEHQSITFAGDLPEGSYVRLMKANFDRLIDGAIDAAKISFKAIGSSSPDLAILISCVGRKMVLKQRIEEEVEGVRDVLGEHTALTGFYSYGEMSPFGPGEPCALHNQTMTITTLTET